MKNNLIKKIFTFALFLGGIFTLTGCANNLEETTLKLDSYSLEQKAVVTVGYAKEKGIVVEDNEFYPEAGKIFKNEKENYVLKLDLVEDSNYQDNYDADSSEKGFKKIEYNGFKGYVLEDTWTLDGKLLIEDMKNSSYLYLEITLEAFERGSKLKLDEVFNSKEVQEIFKSIKYGVEDSNESK